MSMRVFYAYLFKENATFNDLQKARTYIDVGCYTGGKPFGYKYKPTDFTIE